MKSLAKSTLLENIYLTSTVDILTTHGNIHQTE
ncbi:unnamed protein product, partial [Rotaria sp. Silwood2]